MEWTPGTPLPFETAENFRELGGWPAADGRRVKRGLFWRSGALRHIVTPEDRERFEKLGIRVVCDLRSGVERAREPDPEFSGVRRHDIGAIRDARGGELPIDANDSLHLDADGLRALWREMEAIYSALPFANPAYREMFREILAGELPLLCRKGPHRCCCRADPAGAGREQRNRNGGFSCHQRLSPRRGAGMPGGVPSRAGAGTGAAPHTGNSQWGAAGKPAGGI